MRLTFYAYLKKQIGRDDLIGDLAAIAATTPGQKPRSLYGWQNFFMGTKPRRGATALIDEALWQLWQEWTDAEDARQLCEKKAKEILTMAKGTCPKCKAAKEDCTCKGKKGQFPPAKGGKTGAGGKAGGKKGGR